MMAVPKYQHPGDIERDPVAPVGASPHVARCRRRFAIPSMRCLRVKPPPFAGPWGLFEHAQDTPPLSRAQAAVAHSEIPAAAYTLTRRTPTPASITRDGPRLAASRSQEPFGSYAPSIRAGDDSPHTRNCIHEAWRRVSLLLFGSQGNPGSETETHTSSVVPTPRRAGTQFLAAQAACPFTIAPSGISPCST
jgi:hypothetical protein